MLELCVCIGSACHDKGSFNVIQTFQQMIEEKKLHEKIHFKSSFCIQKCYQVGVAVSINGEVHHVAAEKAREFFHTVVEGQL